MNPYIFFQSFLRETAASRLKSASSGIVVSLSAFKAKRSFHGVPPNLDFSNPKPSKRGIPPHLFQHLEGVSAVRCPADLFAPHWSDSHQFMLCATFLAPGMTTPIAPIYWKN
jgi:hypothetical protein